jgi:GNAT superfamily N-acetyltransferase
MDIVIREIRVDDSKAVNLLSHQLGYPLTIDETNENIQRVIQSADHIGFIAEFNNRVVGWIGASQATMIEVMPHCEINGLVIDLELHGKGIGKLLIEKVKQWATQQGNKKISLHCNVKRAGAHLFYRHIGFKEIKQQTNFVLDL